MTEKKSYQSWTISDELWNVIKDEIPQKKRDPEKVYKNKLGQGRKPMDARKALEGIFYVLRTGCQWKALPKELAPAVVSIVISRHGQMQDFSKEYGQ